MTEQTRGRMGTPRPVCRPYGDAAVLVEFADAAFEERWAAARDLGRALRRERPSGLVDLVTAFDTVLVELDPLTADPADLASVISRLAGHGGADDEPRELRLPVVYGGRHGPDLEQLADLLETTPQGFVSLHTSEPWTVRFVGSPLGAPLMDGPRLPRTVPRLTSPRTRLDPGSVGVSGHQTTVYNSHSPGGWQLVGRTPLRLFDLEPPHVTYSAGDRLRMVPVDPEAWGTLASMTLDAYQLEADW